MSMVPRARIIMDMGVGYNGHVYRHVGGTSCVNNKFLIVKKKKKKVIFKCRNLHFGGSEIKKIYILSEDGAPWTLMPIMGHHGHVNGAPKHVHCTLSGAYRPVRNVRKRLHINFQISNSLGRGPPKPPPPNMPTPPPPPDFFLQKRLHIKKPLGTPLPVHACAPA